MLWAVRLRACCATLRPERALLRVAERLIGPAPQS
jgi:hypothetical protein